jgi:hypothetical protein
MNRLLLVVTLAGLLALSGASIGYQNQSSGGLEIVDANRTGFVVEENQTTYFVFVVQNRSPQPLRILGMESSCTKEMCFGPSEDFVAATIPARGSFELHCKVVPRGNGPFQQNRIVYLEDPVIGVRKTSVSIAGTIQANGLTPNPVENSK